MDLILNPCGSRRVVELAQLGSGFLITSEPDEHPPGEAEIVLRVDGRERRRRVFLPDGLGKGSRTARMVKAG